MQNYEAGNINLFYSHETEENPIFLGVLTNEANEENRQEIQAIVDHPQPATFENTIAAFARSELKRDHIERQARVVG